MKKQLILTLICSIFLTSCATNPTVITEEYDTFGNLIKKTTASTDAQVEYYRAQTQRDIAIAKDPPLVTVDWEIIALSETQTVILPKFKVYEKKERESIVKTKTTGETIVSGINGFLERIPLPLAIGGLTATAIQGFRSQEEFTPSITANGDIVQVQNGGEATADKSSKITKTTTTTQISESHLKH